MNQKNENLYLYVDSYCSIETICIENSLKNEIGYVKNQYPAHYLYFKYVFYQNSLKKWKLKKKKNNNCDDICRPDLCGKSQTQVKSRSWLWLSAQKKVQSHDLTWLFDDLTWLFCL